MTDAELRAQPGMIDMCNSLPFALLLNHLEQTCPYVGKEISDPTSIVRNEGKMTGAFETIRRARTIHIAPKVPEKSSGEPARLYPNPEEHNQPKKIK
jgi:hypothetical protein